MGRLRLWRKHLPNVEAQLEMERRRRKKERLAGLLQQRRSAEAIYNSMVVAFCAGVSTIVIMELTIYALWRV